jgi:hypothetical protein
MILEMHTVRPRSGGRALGPQTGLTEFRKLAANPIFNVKVR